MQELSKAFEIEPPTNEDIQHILSDLDINQDGELDF